MAGTKIKTFITYMVVLERKKEDKETKTKNTRTYMDVLHI